MNSLPENILVDLSDALKTFKDQVRWVEFNHHLTIDVDSVLMFLSNGIKHSDISLADEKDIALLASMLGYRDALQSGPVEAGNEWTLEERHSIYGACFELGWMLRASLIDLKAHQHGSFQYRYKGIKRDHLLIFTRTKETGIAPTF